MSDSQVTNSLADRQRREEIARLGPIQRGRVNGADILLNALVLYSQLSDADKAVLKHWRRTLTSQIMNSGRKVRSEQLINPNFKADAGLFARIQPILALLRQGRNADYFDWGIDQGKAMWDNHLNDIRSSLGTVTLWGAAYEFQEDPSSAIGDLAAMEALNRKSSSNEMGLGESNALDSAAFTLLALNAPLLQDVPSADLNYLLDSSAIAQQFEEGMDGDAEGQQALIDAYTDPATRKGTLIAARAADTPPVTAAALIAQTQWQIKTDQAFARTLSESDAQFQQWLAQVQSDPGPFPPFTNANYIPSEFGYTRWDAQMDVEQATMVKAGMALEHGNQAQFESIHDPATGAPFLYTESENGFQLSAPLKLEGEPAAVTLSFPRAVSAN